MDIYNPVINLCLKGTQAEFEGRKADACHFYQRAWEAVTDHYEACIAAHYMARCNEAKRYYDLAAKLGFAHQVDE